MKRMVKQLLTVLLVLTLASSLAFFLYHYDNKYTAKGAQPIVGVLFVEEEDWQSNPLRFLWNGWQFYPDKLLTPEDMDGLDTAGLVSLAIGEHNNFSFAGGSQSPHGCGSYLLTLRLPDVPHTYAIELPEVFSAYRFYVNDQLLLEMGDPDAEEYRPQLQNRIVTFTASGSTRLLLAVRSESYLYSGLVYPPAFGEPQAVVGLQNLRLFICAAAMTITLLFAVLSLWVSVKTSRKRQNTELFCLLCLSIAVSISYSAVHTLLPMSVQPWYPIELVCWYLTTLFIVMLHNRLCDVPPKARQISGVLVAAFCFGIFCYGIMSSRLTLSVIAVFDTLIPIFKFCTAAYLLATSVFALYRQERQSGIIFYADIFYAAMLLRDRLLPAYEPVLGGWFQEWGSLGLVLSLGVILWQDVSVGYRLSLTFQEERRQMERQIEMQQEHYRQIFEKVEESRRMRHDFRQHLHAIMGMAGDGAAQTEYISKMIQVSEAARPESYFENLAIDSLLYHYLTVAREHGIAATVQAAMPKGTILPDEVAFCTILGNLMENAVEACQRQQEGERFLRLAARCREGRLYLMLENSFDGALSEGRSGYLSRKHEGEGIGIVSVKELTQKLGGDIQFVAEKNLFQAMLMLPVEELIASATE